MDISMLIALVQCAILGLQAKHEAFRSLVTYIYSCAHIDPLYPRLADVSLYHRIKNIHRVAGHVALIGVKACRGRYVHCHIWSCANENARSITPVKKVSELNRY